MDWSPLADADPIPGNPEQIAGLTARLSATGEVIEDQTSRLRALNHTGGFWRGEAAQAFAEQQEELPGLLEKLSGRYDAVRAALTAYCPRLDEAQRLAGEALGKARGATADISEARQGIQRMEDHTQAAQRAAERFRATNPSAAARPPEPWLGPDWREALAQGEADLEAARCLLDQARQIRDGAADRCADAIDDAIDDDLKDDDSLWGSIKRGATHAAEWAVDHLPIEGLSQFFTWASAALGILSLAFPFLAPVALTAAAISLALDTTLALAGEGSWKNVLYGVIAVATFGIGRTATGVSRGVRAGAATSRLGMIARLSNLKGLRALAPSGAVTTGAAFRSTMVSQLRRVKDFYSKPMSLVREFKELRSLLKTPVQTLKASFQGQVAALTGKIAPEIAGVPAVRAAGDLSTAATRITQAGFGVEAAVAAEGAVNTVADAVSESAFERGARVKPIPVVP